MELLITLIWLYLSQHKMTKKIKFNIDKYKDIILKNSMIAVMQINNELFDRIRENSPVRTWRYLAQTINMWVTRDWDKLIGKIRNEWPYSEKVEHWWRSKPVNRHLRSWSIYFSIWAKPFLRSIEEIKSKFTSLIKAKIW